MIYWAGFDKKKFMLTDSKGEGTEPMIFYTNRELYQKILSSVEHSQMIFIGENPHRNRSIHTVVAELMIELAKQTDFQIYATEMVYSLYPFMEESSRHARESRMIPAQITNYNKSMESHKRIICTALDMAHDVRHSPHLVMEFMENLMDGLTDSSLRQALSEICRLFPGNEDAEDKEILICRMKEITEQYRGSIEDDTFRELSFYYELLLASLEIGGLNFQSQDDQRNRWFIRTIENALERLKQDRARMVCHVGAPHAYKSYLNEDDYYVGKIPEAAYFDRKGGENPVFSLQIRPFFWTNRGDYSTTLTDPLEILAFQELKDSDAVYVDLREYCEKADENTRKKYSLNGQFQFDGILFVKEICNHEYQIN